LNTTDRFGMYASDTEDSYALAKVQQHSSGDRLAAAIAHGGTAFAWFLAPLVVYLIKRGDSRWASYHALQALLWSLLGTVVSLATCGLAIPVFLVFHLIAAYKVFVGQDYAYPIVGEVARQSVEERT
jgi:uncharacterized membrane protein